MPLFYRLTSITSLAPDQRSRLGSHHSQTVPFIHVFDVVVRLTRHRRVGWQFIRINKLSSMVVWVLLHSVIIIVQEFTGKLILFLLVTRVVCT
jgi:hypothetical protein